jgi:CRP-like cAMP-binding protein
MQDSRADMRQRLLQWFGSLGQTGIESNQNNLVTPTRRAAEALGVPPESVYEALGSLRADALIQTNSRSGVNFVYHTALTPRGYD